MKETRSAGREPRARWRGWSRAPPGGPLASGAATAMGHAPHAISGVSPVAPRATQPRAMRDRAAGLRLAPLNFNPALSLALRLPGGRSVLSAVMW